MSDSLEIQTMTGAAVEAHIPALARLRIQVFREFPYLYDGDLDYEARYLRTYARAPGSVVVLVLDGGKAVGASTALPLTEADPAFQRPFREQGFEPSRVFYLGESVLLPAYRGRGLGVRFFEEREAHARRLGGFSWATFCAVDRPADHPRRPPEYRPLDAFWDKRGYSRHPELVATFRWKDLDEERETEKPMTFWLKRLTVQP
jgi:GNAT superfamily N-acetyltransferase